jgi:hypothetical protein
MKYVLYDILADSIMLFEKKPFLGFKYCLHQDNTADQLYYIRNHPRNYPDRYVVLGRLYGRRGVPKN